MGYSGRLLIPCALPHPILYGLSLSFLSFESISHFPVSKSITMPLEKIVLMKPIWRLKELLVNLSYKKCISVVFCEYQRFLHALLNFNIILTLSMNFQKFYFLKKSQLSPFIRISVKNWGNLTYTVAQNYRTWMVGQRGREEQEEGERESPLAAKSPIGGVNDFS